MASASRPPQPPLLMPPPLLQPAPPKTFMIALPFEENVCPGVAKVEHERLVVCSGMPVCEEALILYAVLVLQYS